MCDFSILHICWTSLNFITLSLCDYLCDWSLLHQDMLHFAKSRNTGKKAASYVLFPSIEKFTHLAVLDYSLQY